MFQTTVEYIILILWISSAKSRFKSFVDSSLSYDLTNISSPNQSRIFFLSLQYFLPPIRFYNIVLSVFRFLCLLFSEFVLCLILLSFTSRRVRLLYHTLKNFVYFLEPLYHLETCVGGMATSLEMLLSILIVQVAGLTVIVCRSQIAPEIVLNRVVVICIRNFASNFTFFFT